MTPPPAARRALGQPERALVAAQPICYIGAVARTPDLWDGVDPPAAVAELVDALA